MTAPTTVEADTNTTRNSCVEVHCDCNTMWSMAQQFSTLRLSTEIGPFRARLVKDDAVRARRIAATYARFYLEIEKNGAPSKKGRFYWMALGAFASKTVACTFEQWQVRGLSFLDSTVRKGLGKGNFWLFCDISGWHWHYCAYPKSFDQCMELRNADTFVPPIKLQMNKLPWKDEALPAIQYLAISNDIRAGFAKVKAFEAETDRAERTALQFGHLLDIANHEQRVVLQPLIYDNPDFARWIQRQRSWYANWVSPTLQLVFAHACETDNPDLKSLAPEGTELEILESRMAWIELAASSFHNLMQEQTSFMEGELDIIARWVDMPDTSQN